MQNNELDTDGQPRALNSQLPPAQPGMNLDDVLYTLFRHKWLIVGCTCLGICAAAAVRVLRPAPYTSTAKVMVPYVIDTKLVNPEDPSFKVSAEYNQSVINSEVEILTSFDVARKAAEAIGIDRLAPGLTGTNQVLAAAGVLAKGLKVEVPPRTSILVAELKHRDPDLVQPALAALLHAYTELHWDVHQGGSVLDERMTKVREQILGKVEAIEEKLKELTAGERFLYIAETKIAFQKQITKCQEEWIDAQSELAVRKAMLGEGVSEGQDSNTNAQPVVLPADKLSAYSFVVSELENLEKKKRELLLLYKEAYPLVQTVIGQIQKLKIQKSELETEFPTLARFASGGIARGTNGTPSDITADLEEVRRLTAKVTTLGKVLSDLQSEALRLAEVERKIAPLLADRQLQQTNLAELQRRAERRVNEAMAGSKVANISVLQEATPPQADNKKQLKMMAVAFAGLIGLGVGLAFLLDLILDRTVRRTVDVERILRLPVFLTIPDAESGQMRLPWNGESDGDGEQVEGNGSGRSMAVAPWTPGHPLQKSAEGLRERVITHFELRDLYAKKPKLVGVAGCSKGAGVSTLASGLASSLSKTGDGNVLLVDMNIEHGVAHSFYKGRPGCGLAEALESKNRSEAQVEENLYLATLRGAGKDKLVRTQQTRLNMLMPQLKASDYDYIIFDMPPVAAGSPTPRLGSYMDLFLLVLESEKTGQQTATRATSLLREARVNVAAVLNKCRRHVPAKLSQEM